MDNFSSFILWSICSLFWWALHFIINPLYKPIIPQLHSTLIRLHYYLLFIIIKFRQLPTKPIVYINPCNWINQYWTGLKRQIHWKTRLNEAVNLGISLIYLRAFAIVWICLVLMLQNFFPFVTELLQILVFIPAKFLFQVGLMIGIETMSLVGTVESIG